MARDGVDRLDFGRGDDDYKRAWTSERTPHIGVLWVGVARRPLLIARHLAGDLKRRMAGFESL
jgi:CelD/BcsL family acetyltransferase involved in cellulose biosynthesis